MVRPPQLPSLPAAAVAVTSPPPPPSAAAAPAAPTSALPDSKLGRALALLRSGAWADRTLALLAITRDAAGRGVALDAPAASALRVALAAALSPQYFAVGLRLWRYDALEWGALRDLPHVEVWALVLHAYGALLSDDVSARGLAGGGALVARCLLLRLADGERQRAALRVLGTAVSRAGAAAERGGPWRWAAHGCQAAVLCLTPPPAAAAAPSSGEAAAPATSSSGDDEGSVAMMVTCLRIIASVAAAANIEEDGGAVFSTLVAALPAVCTAMSSPQDAVFQAALDAASSLAARLAAAPPPGALPALTPRLLQTAVLTALVRTRDVDAVGAGVPVGDTVRRLRAQARAYATVGTLLDAVLPAAAPGGGDASFEQALARLVAADVRECMDYFETVLVADAPDDGGSGRPSEPARAAAHPAGLPLPPPLGRGARWAQLAGGWDAYYALLTTALPLYGAACARHAAAAAALTDESDQSAVAGVIGAAGELADGACRLRSFGGAVGAAPGVVALRRHPGSSVAPPPPSEAAQAWLTSAAAGSPWDTPAQPPPPAEAVAALAPVRAALTATVLAAACSGMALWAGAALDAADMRAPVRAFVDDALRTAHVVAALPLPHRAPPPTSLAAALHRPGAAAVHPPVLEALQRDGAAQLAALYRDILAAAPVRAEFDGREAGGGGGDGGDGDDDGGDDGYDADSGSVAAGVKVGGGPRSSSGRWPEASPPPVLSPAAAAALATPPPPLGPPQVVLAEAGVGEHLDRWLAAVARACALALSNAAAAVAMSSSGAPPPPPAGGSIIPLPLLAQAGDAAAVVAALGSAPSAGASAMAAIGRRMLATYTAAGTPVPPVLTALLAVVPTTERPSS